VFLAAFVVLGESPLTDALRSADFVTLLPDVLGAAFSGAAFFLDATAPAFLAEGRAPFLRFPATSEEAVRFGFLFGLGSFATHPTPTLTVPAQSITYWQIKGYANKSGLV